MAEFITQELRDFIIDEYDLCAHQYGSKFVDLYIWEGELPAEDFTDAIANAMLCIEEKTGYKVRTYNYCWIDNKTGTALIIFDEPQPKHKPFWQRLFSRKK